MCLRSYRSLFLLTAIAVFTSSVVSAQSGPPHSAPASWGPISINLEEYDYPYSVEYMNFSVYGEDVRIAYMDVAPTGPANGRTVIFHHGGYYYSWYWEDQIKALSEEGYRVIAKDRLGWGKSSKPEITYSINLWAANTVRLMDHLGIEESKISMDSKFIDDLGADSLDTVELVMAFEEQFDIEIPLSLIHI